MRTKDKTGINLLLPFTLFLSLITFSNSGICQETITMVYRTTDKSPYIDAAPSNKGLYKTVFEEAAKRVGLKLEIKRYPKKRAYFYLESGECDFYPGASFKPKREKIGYFIENHMPVTGVMLLYHDDISIENISDIKGYTLLYNSGGTTSFYKYIGIDTQANELREVTELGISKAIKILQAKQSDFYAYELLAVESYLKRNDFKGIKTYPVHLKGQVDHLLFSKKSKHYAEKQNPHYKPDQELSINNLPYTLDEKSVAYKFQQALQTMHNNGEIDKLRREMFQ